MSIGHLYTAHTYRKLREKVYLPTNALLVTELLVALYINIRKYVLPVHSVIYDIPTT